MDSTWLKSALLGSKARIAVTAVGALVVALGATVGLGVFGVPSLESVDNEFGETNETTTVVATDLTLDNPNPFGTGFVGVSAEYAIRMNDVEMAEGTKDDIDICTGRSTVHLETYMDNKRIPDWWVSHVRNDEQTEVAIDAEVQAAGQAVPIERERTINTSMIERFNSNETRPINGSTLLVDDPVLYVNQTRGDWGEVTESETPIDTSFVAYNPKSVPYTVTEMRYEITMNDVTVGEGTSREEYVIAPGTTERISTRTAIRNENLDDWWVTHVRNDEVTELRIEFEATVQLDDPSSITGETVEIRVPLNELTHEETIETDLLGSENGTDDRTENVSRSVPRA
ncbi:LEA type 2 family protein [Halostella sp. PRR32]|uniref:LEA type 2 family protein n=1 Tax=Halostella sp. PRR32 TaxID=3098147 RepID=UPI002B1DE277|nr:LEA type 2 family protein [Halostella sp. PRR32]